MSKLCPYCKTKMIMRDKNELVGMGDYIKVNYLECPKCKSRGPRKET